MSWKNKEGWFEPLSIIDSKLFYIYEMFMQTKNKVYEMNKKP